MGLFSCFSKNNNISSKENVYVYGSKEFSDKENSFKITLRQASIICAKHQFKQDINKKEVFTCLNIMYGDYYLFSSFMYNLKSARYNLSGIWIDGNTGEIKEVKTRKNITVIIEHFRYCNKVERANLITIINE